MLLPIVGYGHPTLRRKAEPITAEYPGLAQLIADMFETMYHAQGVGLAAPQINASIRLFVIDAAPMDGTLPGDETTLGFKRVFINAQRVDESGQPWVFEEGCLSIPDIRENVSRPGAITLSWLDEQFQPHTQTFTGIKARVIQHEYDHIEGILFTDHISPLRKQVVKPRLLRIQRGDFKPDYPMKLTPKK